MSTVVSVDCIKTFLLQVLLTAGCDSRSAETTSEGLLLGSLRGVDSHGIRLLPHYIKALKAGRLNPKPNLKFERTGAATGTLDADHGLGFPAGIEAVDQATRLAHEAGVGVISVKNSSHGGIMAYYTLTGAEKGFITLACTNTTPRLIPPGAKEPFLGTNPLSYAVPSAQGHPLCYDAATTALTGNKIRICRETGMPLPEGVATTADGVPTIDPNQAEYLVPFGGYKGFGIALLIDILCGALAGMPHSSQVSQMYGASLTGKRYLGQCFIAIDPGRFPGGDQFAETISEEITRLRNLPNHEYSNTISPGDPEAREYRKRSKTGIFISPELLNELDQISDNLNIPKLTAS